MRSSVTLRSKGDKLNSQNITRACSQTISSCKWAKRYKMLSKCCRPHQSAHIMPNLIKLSFMSRTNGKDFKSWGLEEGINALRSRLVLNSGWNPQKWGKEENPGLAALPISTSNFEETIFFLFLLYPIWARLGLIVCWGSANSWLVF